MTKRGESGIKMVSRWLYMVEKAWDGERMKKKKKKKKFKKFKKS